MLVLFHRMCVPTQCVRPSDASMPCYTPMVVVIIANVRSRRRRRRCRCRLRGRLSTISQFTYTHTRTHHSHKLTRGAGSSDYSRVYENGWTVENGRMDHTSCIFFARAYFIPTYPYGTLCEYGTGAMMVRLMVRCPIHALLVLENCFYIIS